MQQERHGAAAVVIRNGHVLLARRINPPDEGLWGYPGGHVEHGETAPEAAIRELFEETGVVALPSAVLDTLHVGDSPRFRLDMVLCRYVSGEPQPADDISAAEWVPFDDVRVQAREMSRDVDTILARALDRQ
ncbi:NUDIX hydrolase [Palleronia sp.]|uniref:NUDIX hydrolase n=1 Tax=Palleronia sp. TaxID=1940284 RepID=UPI0035C864BE